MAGFNLFPSLPPELRRLVWEKALPRPLGPQLYCYREGCWGRRTQYFLPDEEGYDPELDLIYEFRHELLNPVRLELPLFFVNHEANKIAVAWMRSQSLRVEFVYPPEGLFARLFDPDRDTLYVPPHEWNAFLREPALRPFEPDLVERNLDCPGVSFSRLAFSEAMLKTERDPLPDIFCWYDRVKEIFVLRSPEPALNSEGDSIGLQGAWEMHDVTGPVCSWTGEEIESNIAGADKNDELHAKIEDISKKAVPFLGGYGKELQFKICSATPVPRVPDV